MLPAVVQPAAEAERAGNKHIPGGISCHSQECSRPVLYLEVLT